MKIGEWARTATGQWSGYWDDGIFVVYTEPLGYETVWAKKIKRWDESWGLPMSMILHRIEMISDGFIGPGRAEILAPVYLDQLEKWLNHHLALCYRPGDDTPEPARTIAAALARRRAERNGIVQTRLPGSIADHYPLLRNPSIFDEYERCLAAELLRG